MFSLAVGAAALALAPLSSNAFYLPGAAPHNYGRGEKVELFVNALTPMLAGSDSAKLVCSPNSVMWSELI